MKLPNLEQALVLQAKITEYLLSVTHEDGKNKAEFFMQFGFTVESWEALAEALTDHAAKHEVAKVMDTPYGTNYVIEGELETPVGRTPLIRAVWVIDFESEIPRLVTAYPL
jgi:hypothetical protein